MVVLPLFVLVTQLMAPHHHTPVHHPYVRPHHLRTAGPGPRAMPLHKAPPAVPAAPAHDDDDIEDVESVAPVVDAGAQAPAAGSPGAAASDAATAPPPGALEDHVLGVVPNAAAPLGTLPWLAGALGHLHAAWVHLPIAWLLLWALVEVLSLISDHAALRPSALTLAVLTLLSFAPAALSGLCRLDELASTTHGYDTAEALVHRNLIFAAAGLCAGCLVLRLIVWRWPNMFCRLLCLMGVVTACAITSYSAHLGGRMVYGADFLPF